MSIRPWNKCADIHNYIIQEIDFTHKLGLDLFKRADSPFKGQRINFRDLDTDIAGNICINLEIRVHNHSLVQTIKIFSIKFTKKMQKSYYSAVHPVFIPAAR